MIQTGYSIRFSDYAKMAPSERAAALGRLVDAAKESPTPGRLAELDAKILDYEKAHFLDSEDMLAGLASGEIKETAEMAAWMFYLDLRSHLSSPSVDL